MNAGVSKSTHRLASFTFTSGEQSKDRPRSPWGGAGERGEGWGGPGLNWAPCRVSLPHLTLSPQLHPPLEQTGSGCVLVPAPCAGHEGQGAWHCLDSGHAPALRAHAGSAVSQACWAQALLLQTLGTPYPQLSCPRPWSLPAFCSSQVFKQNLLSPLY